jgi:hypothetical protein
MSLVRAALVLFHILPSFLTSFLRACRMNGKESSITPLAVPAPFKLAELLQPAEIVHLQSDSLVQWNARSLASPSTPPAPISSTMPQTTPAQPTSFHVALPPAFSSFSPFMVAEAVQVQPAATAPPPAPTNGIQSFAGASKSDRNLADTVTIAIGGAKHILNTQVLPIAGNRAYTHIRHAVPRLHQVTFDSTGMSAHINVQDWMTAYNNYGIRVVLELFNHTGILVDRRAGQTVNF